jgi:hypothetical protein
VGHEGARDFVVSDFGVQCVLKVDTTETSSFVFENLDIALLASSSFRIPNDLGIGYAVTCW